VPERQTWNRFDGDPQRNAMPEGHTIHRLARDQTCILVGKTLNVSSPQGRFATGAHVLDGLRLHSIRAFGKHLFYQFDPPETGPVLHVHLGLFGKFRVRKRVGDELPEVRGATRVRFIAPDRVVDLNGPNQCEVIEPHEMQAIIDRLGPDPLREDADPKRAWDRIHKSRTAIGQLIMDQSVIAGIGNIYRTELLFRAGLPPDMPGRDLSRRTFNRLWKDAVKLLHIGVKHNRIITVDLDKIDKPAGRLRYGERTLIFGKTKCPVCASDITRFEISKRRAFRCDSCQPKCET
jgi:endonuclease-8